VKDSTPVAGVNIPQLVGEEDGTLHVKTYDWHSYFISECTPLIGMKSIAHFRFTSQNKGVVFYRTSLSDQEQSKELISSIRFHNLPCMPKELTPPGLSLERCQYLFKNIREFVRYECRDRVCPEPHVL
jgi:hypothetical protein